MLVFEYAYVFSLSNPELPNPELSIQFEKQFEFQNELVSKNAQPDCRLPSADCLLSKLPLDFARGPGRVVEIK